MTRSFLKVQYRSVRHSSGTVAPHYYSFHVHSDFARSDTAQYVTKFIKMQTCVHFIVVMQDERIT
jgi:hypothetical protein